MESEIISPKRQQGSTRSIGALDKCKLFKNFASAVAFNLKRAVGACCRPFVLSQVEAWMAYNTLTRRVIEKSRSPFDKAQDERDFSRLNCSF